MIHTIPKVALDIAYNSLLSYSNLDTLAFVINSVTGSELALYLINNINKELDANPYREICLYSLHKELPIILPRFAIFPSVDLISCNKPLIALDIQSWQASLTTIAIQKYLYLYDIKIIDHIATDMVNKINESSFRLIARTKKHSNYLKNKGFVNIISTNIPELNIPDFIRICNENI